MARFLALLAVLASLSFSHSAAGQEALSAAEHDPEGPLITAEEVKALARIAGLTEAQAEVAEMLRDALAADFKSAQVKRQRSYDEMESEERPMSPEDRGHAFEAIGREFRARCAELEAAYLNDVRGVLNEAQAARWADFERYRRRARSKGWWDRPAADVDLVKIVEGLGLAVEARAAVRPLEEEYELEMDPAVQARLALKREAAQTDWGGDWQKRSTWYGRAYDLSQSMDRRLADINRKYARLIGALLPADRLAEFETRFVEASFVNLYSPSENRRKLTAAAALADLTDSQRAEVERILGPFRRDVAAAEKAAEGLEDEHAYQYSYAQVQEGKGPKGYHDRYDEIWGLESRALAAVRKVLTEDQRERVQAAGEDGE